MRTKPHTLSDGTTIVVTTTRTMIGTELREVPSRKRPAGSLLWDDGRMYLISRRHHVRITHPDYEYAADEKAAAAKALAFFVESAEAVIKHAADENIPVEQCY